MTCMRAAPGHLEAFSTTLRLTCPVRSPAAELGASRDIRKVESRTETPPWLLFFRFLLLGVAVWQETILSWLLEPY